VAYLTLPVGSDTDRDCKPDKPLPLVLNVHGGPWYRDSYRYNPRSVWLANRGYATLQINFRGSTGFGKDFVNKADKEWGRKMHDDLIDGVDWAVSNGIWQGGHFWRLLWRVRGALGCDQHAGPLFVRRGFCCSIEPQHAARFHPSVLGVVQGADVPPHWRPSNGRRQGAPE
jgi:hypothetical protein